VNQGCNFTFTTPGYFDAMGVPLLSGRGFQPGDDAQNEPVIIINRRFAELFFGDSDPIGQRLHVGFDLQPLRRIVGVVGDTRHSTLTDEINPGIYAPYYQVPWGGSLALAVRSTLPSETVVSTVRGALLQAEPALRVYGAATVHQVLSDSVARPRFTTLLVGLFSFIALLLAAVGIYGVIRYNVGRRTHEIGVRIALGADAGEIVGLIMRQGVLLVVVGLVLGGVAALFTTRVLSSQLYGVSATDPATYIGVGVVLAAVALAASYLPARRATRVDPVNALRQE
jgi:putative ABC transport system permease protein